MSAYRVSFHAILVCLAALSLSACGQAGQVILQALQSPTPPPTPSPPPPDTGAVGQRVEWIGWAIAVSDVLRSSLNPRELNPGNYRPDEWDYLSMDVTVERTGEEQGLVDGNDFYLVDSSGAVYKQDLLDANWVYMRGAYYPGRVGSERIVIPVPEEAQDLALRFAPSPELPQPIEIALDQVGRPRRIDLREAIEMGLLSADVRGMSLQSIELELEVSAELEDSLELTIAPGTLFLAPSPDLQTMVVRREMVLFLEPKRELSVKLQVACANMTLKAPEGGETYTVQIEPPGEELRKLLGLPEFHDGSFRLQQFAIWMITDNPSRGSFVGLGSGGQGSPPSGEELGQIRAWFEAASIPAENYAGFR